MSPIKTPATATGSSSTTTGQASKGGNSNSNSGDDDDGEKNGDNGEGAVAVVAPASAPKAKATSKMGGLLMKAHQTGNLEGAVDRMETALGDEGEDGVKPEAFAQEEKGEGEGEEEEEEEPAVRRQSCLLSKLRHGEGHVQTVQTFVDDDGNEYYHHVPSGRTSYILEDFVLMEGWEEVENGESDTISTALYRHVETGQTQSIRPGTEGSPQYDALYESELEVEESEGGVSCGVGVGVTCHVWQDPSGVLPETVVIRAAEACMQLAESTGGKVVVKEIPWAIITQYANRKGTGGDMDMFVVAANGASYAFEHENEQSLLAMIKEYAPTATVEAGLVQDDWL
jgi:hypothetical protein